MKSPTSKKNHWIKSILILPLIAILLVAFSQKETVEKEITQTQKTTPNIESKEIEGVSEELMKEYNEFMEIFKSSNYILFDKYKRIVPIYELMSEDQQNSVEKYPASPSSGLTKTKPKKPTLDQFESWKNKEQFALWLDGKVIENTVLDDLSISEVYHFFGSGVMNNAQSERFPQPYQFHLHTKTHFENTIVKSNLNKYNRILKTYDKHLKSFLKSDRLDNTELKILKNQIDKSYKNFSDEELKKWEVKLAPPVPSTKKKTQQNPAPPVPSTKKKTQQNPAPPAPVRQETKKFKSPSDVPPPPASTKADKVNKPKKLIQHHVRLTDKNGEVYNEKRTEYPEKDKQVIPQVPPVDKTNTLQEALEKSVKEVEKTFVANSTEQPSNTIKILINKKGDYLMDGEYASIEDFTKRIKGFTADERKKLTVNIVATEDAPIDDVDAVKTVLRSNNVLKVYFSIHHNSYSTSKSSDEQITSQKTVNIDGDIPITELDKYPIYPGCSGNNEAIKACFNKSMQMHIYKKFNGDLVKSLDLSPGKKKVYAQLRISKTGKIEVISSRGPHEALNEEMKRVVKLYPKVTPGTYKENKVDVISMIPITFYIE